MNNKKYSLEEIYHGVENWVKLVMIEDHGIWLEEYGWDTEEEIVASIVSYIKKIDQQK